MVNPGKVRLLVCSVDSYPNVGGVSTFAFELTNALSGLDVECTYLGTKSARFDKGTASFRVYNDWESSPTLRAGRGFEDEDRRLVDLFRSVVEAFEITHLVAYHPFYYAPAMIAAGKAVGIPTAVVVHGTELTSQFPEIMDDRRVPFDRDFAGSDLRARLGHVVANADHVLANSSHTAALVERIAPQISARVVGCGISRALFEREIAESPRYDAAERRTRRAALGLDTHTTIIYVGRLVRHKNLEHLIRLCSLTGFNGLIVGDGPMRPSLERAARSSGAKVTFAGRVDEATKWRLLRSADFGYLMSTHDESSGAYEGFGISLLEYAAAGVACLANGLHGTSDFARDMVTSVGGAGDATDVARRILAASADATLLERLVSNARNAVAESFTWDLVAQRVLESINAE